MGYYIFDFDGTIAEISHRRHHVEPPNRNWDAFFEACDQDAPLHGALTLLKMLRNMTGPARWGIPSKDAVNRVEIWSGRSKAVIEKSMTWLSHQGVINPESVLVRMREIGDYRPDEVIKLEWLTEERALGNEPDVIFDDRKKVVEMWRANGATCFQVNPGDFDKPETARPHKLYEAWGLPILTLLVGPSGAGKSRWADRLFDPRDVISSDQLRVNLTGSLGDQSRNLDVFSAIEAMVKVRLAYGLPTCVDATNLKKKDRMVLAKLAPAHLKVAYIMINRPMAEKFRDAGAERLNATVKGRPLLEAHEMRYQAQRKDICKGDDLPNVEVFDEPEKFQKALEERSAAWRAKGDQTVQPAEQVA